MRATIRFVSLGLPVLAALPLVAGCPTDAGNPYAQKPKPAAPKVGVEDPRVVERDGELYTQKTIERIEERERDDDKARGLGSGRPDETNGECRLYAPELPHPQCCKAEFGFDVDAAQKHCDVDIYLGESFRYSCGYYFHDDAGYRWFRLSKLPDTDPAKSAEHHDRKLVESLGDKYTKSSPVPGVPGAYWSRHERFRWAFLPGWDNVRQLSWDQRSCSDEGITELMKEIIAAKPAPEGSRRLSKTPKARK